jgi:dynein heavy chain, axonemal
MIALFRPVAIMLPDFGIIARVRFTAAGFNDPQLAALKVLSVFQLCRDRFSLTTPLSTLTELRTGSVIVDVACAYKRALEVSRPSAESDMAAVQSAVTGVLLPSVAACDVGVFTSIISLMFPAPSLVPETMHGEAFGAQIDSATSGA